MTSPERDDRGLTTIYLVVAMTALLIGAAFAIDVGRYVVEARSAQNSADATVLAVATDCALSGAPIADYTPYRKPGQAISAPACGDGEASIIVTTPVNEGLFLHRNAGTVTREAGARWGTLAGANTLPLVISSCEFSEALLEGSSDIILYLDDPKPQSGCSSLPGGFSQLRSDDDCNVEVSAGGTVEGKPGADLHKQIPCIGALPQDLLIPMYDAEACATTGCTGNGTYLIDGFAMFRITGYSFQGNNHGGTLGKDCPDHKDRGRHCIRGDFIRFATSQGTPGDSRDFGTYQIFLSR